MDINDPRIYDAAFLCWLMSLDDNDRHGIYGEVVERHYPDGFHGFVTDCLSTNTDLELGVDHG